MTERFVEAGNKGHAFIWEQRWEDAVKAFEYALRGIPKDPTLYDGLATAYRELGDFPKALDNYQQAARISNGDPIYLEQVADIQQRLGLYSEAGQTWMWIGEMRLRENKLDEAVDKWMLASRLNPELLKAHERLAAVFERQGRTVQAINEYMEVARLFEAQGNNFKALEACQAALNLDPRNPDVLTALELLQTGEKAFGSEGTIRPPAVNFDAPPSRMVKAAERQKRTVSPIEEALQISREKMAEEIFSSSDSDVDEIDQMSRMAAISQALDFQTRGLINEAIHSYEQVLETGVKTPAVYFNLGLLYQEKLRFEEAIQVLLRSVKSVDYRLASHFALGESYRALGKVNQAIEHFINVLQIVDLATVQHEQADRLIQLYENLADSLIASGERDKASEFSNTLVEFLSHRGWEDKVKEARGRLDSLSDGDGTMILGDILTAGSSRVLESLFLAKEHGKRHLYHSAMEEIYRAIEISPTYLPAHMQMGELLVKLQRIEQGVHKFITIGDVCIVRNDVHEATRAYQRAVDISPLNHETRVKLIELLKQHDNYDDAIDQYLSMGESYYQIAQIDKARQTYIDGLKLAPRGSADKKWRSKLLQKIADIDMQRLDWRQALPVYRELRRAEPNDERVAITFVDVLFKTGDRDQALRELDRYLVQLAKTGKGGKLLGILEDMVGHRPTEAGLVDRLTRLYIQQRRTSKAIELLDHLGEAQLETGQTTAAVVTIKKILSLNPPNKEAYHQLLSQLKS